ncbi:MAG: nicotinate dehydrogenase medium molybdopterin subunit, partial [Nitrospinota bacterium]|nr:nicotinate dehydrogenase medium molybdopterin subunit [Nitrospinota bacterium]
SEELSFIDGKVMNPSFLSYKLPTALDMPEVVPILVETPHADGPFGAKGAGEIVTLPAAAAVVNAIRDAVGVRIRRTPATPERVFRALQEKAAGVS